MPALLLPASHAILTSMHPSFSDPYWLLLIVPLFWLLIHFQRNSFIPTRRSKQATWFIVRCIILILVIFALAGLQLNTRIRKSQTLFLVDVSDSVAPQQKEEALAFVNEAMRRIAPPDRIASNSK